MTPVKIVKARVSVEDNVYTYKEVNRKMETLRYIENGFFYTASDIIRAIKSRRECARHLAPWGMIMHTIFWPGNLR
jgi:hypothetical protein